MSSNDTEDLQAWKQVHQQLINAVLIAKDAVAIQKAQRRYWLTEINANLTPEGKLTAASVWKRPSRKGGKRVPKGDKPTSTKRKRKDATGGDDKKPAKKPRKSKKKATAEVAADDDDEPLAKPAAKKKLKLHLKQNPVVQEVKHPQEDDTEEEEDLHDHEQEEVEESEDEHEGSFLTAPGFASGQQWGAHSAGMAVMASAADYAADTAEPSGYSSFLPTNSYILDQSHYGGHGFAAQQAQEEESDEDTEEDDY